MKEASQAIEALDDTAIASIIDGGSVEVLGEALGLDDLVVARDPHEGVVVASNERLSVALDTAVTPDLEREGLAREMVKVIQGLRRDAGLDVSDRVVVRWQTENDVLIAAIEAHTAWISGEVLAESLVRVATEDSRAEVLGVPLDLSVERAAGTV